MCMCVLLNSTKDRFTFEHARFHFLSKSKCTNQKYYIVFCCVFTKKNMHEESIVIVIAKAGHFKSSAHP